MSELAVGSLAGLSSNSFVVDVASGSTLDLSNGAVFPAGNVINIYSEQMTTTQSFTAGSADFTDLTGLSITLTPTSSSSKFIIFATAYMSNSFADFEPSNQIRVLRDGSEIIKTKILVRQTSNASAILDVPAYVFDSPGTTSSVTYKVQGTQNVSGSAGTVYVNRAPGSTELRGNSYLHIMEVAG